MVEVEPLVSRRAALTASAVAATAVVTGCGDTRGAAGSPGAATAAEPDERLLRRALQREEELQAELRQAARRYLRLRVDLQRAVAVHEDHVEVLARSLGTRPGTAAVDDGPRADPRSVARSLAARERSVAEAHAAASLEARSGPFARVLAGMAAAADQQALVLDALPVRGSRRG